MLSTRSEILEKINLGEDSFLELKEVRFSGAKVTEPKQPKIADELAAFANGRGGVLLLGVEDKTREILGIPKERLDAVEEMVRNACQDSITPALTPVIERMNLPNANGHEVPVIRIEVDRSLFVHQSPGGYFNRIGSSKRSMSPEFLARLFQQRSQSRLIRFDEQAVPKAQMNDFSDELWKRFVTKRSENDRDTFLTKLGMAQRDDQDILRPSVSGILMATDDPRIWFSNAFIQAVAYRGSDVISGSGYQLDAEDISGPLDQQIFRACHFVKKNMRIGADKQQGRIDQPQFDLAAVFEAVVNAVAHRDYSIYGSKIRLHLFSDRLELYSPGTIPNSMTIETLAYRQAARNEVISSLLAKCPISSNPEINTDRSTIMDKRGEGVSIILGNTERLSGKSATYTLIDDAELLLTIYSR